MFTVPDTASSQYSLKAQHSGRPAWQSFLSRDVVLAVLHSFWAWQKPASLFPYREITRLIVSNSLENSVLNADLREDWKRENIEFSREFNIKCVTLVSACVTLWNAARPLFTGVVSACQPIFQFFLWKKWRRVLFANYGHIFYCIIKRQCMFCSITFTREKEKLEETTQAFLPII